MRQRERQERERDRREKQRVRETIKEVSKRFIQVSSFAVRDAGYNGEVDVEGERVKRDIEKK